MPQQLDRWDHVDIVFPGVGHQLADFLETEPVVFLAQLGVERIDEMVRLDEPQVRVDFESREETDSALVFVHRGQLIAPVILAVPAHGQGGPIEDAHAGKGRPLS